MGVLRYLFPIEHVKRIEDVDYHRLMRSGYDTFLFDYDFTLAPWKTLDIDSRTLKLFEELRDMGARIFVVTNARRERVEHLKKVAPWLEINWSMRKPSIKKISEILRRNGVDPRRCVIIGDLFLTDILAGNRMGMYTIMVNPRLYEAKEFYKWVVGGLSVALYRIVFFLFGWFFRLASMISPNEWVENIREIDYKKLLDHGFEFFVFDYDNTLTPWKSCSIPEVHLKILKDLSESGVEVLVASNGSERNVDLPVPVVWRAGKPLGFKIKKFMKRRCLNPRRTVVIGDQLFTDVLFGNLVGAYTVKTSPLRHEEAVITKINRLLEKIFSKVIVRKPRIQP